MNPTTSGPARSTPVNMPYIRSQIDRLPDIEKQLKEEATRGEPGKGLSKGVEKLHVLKRLVEAEDALAKELGADRSSPPCAQQRAEALQLAQRDLEATTRRAIDTYAAFQQLKADLFPLGDEEMIAKAQPGLVLHDMLFELIVEWRRLTAECAILRDKVRRFQ